MASGSVGAILVILSMTTSGTPATDLDDTHVIVQTFGSMEECKAMLAAAPLSSMELETERFHRLRVLRSCIKPDDQFWYTWTDGHVVSGDGAVVEAGSHRER